MHMKQWIKNHTHTYLSIYLSNYQCVVCDLCVCVCVCVCVKQ
jgi:hypothetical protein